jgi:hypothetical protein
MYVRFILIQSGTCWEDGLIPAETGRHSRILTINKRYVWRIFVGTFVYIPQRDEARQVVFHDISRPAACRTYTDRSFMFVMCSVKCSWLFPNHYFVNRTEYTAIEVMCVRTFFFPRPIKIRCVSQSFTPTTASIHLEYSTPVRSHGSHWG